MVDLDTPAIVLHVRPKLSPFCLLFPATEASPNWTEKYAAKENSCVNSILPLAPAVLPAQTFRTSGGKRERESTVRPGMPPSQPRHTGGGQAPRLQPEQWGDPFLSILSQRMDARRCKAAQGSGIKKQKVFLRDDTDSQHNVGK